MVIDLNEEMLLDRSEWYNKCKAYGYIYALFVLTYYVKAKQPNTFLPTCTSSRSMAKIASLAIEGKDIDSDIVLTDTEYGFDLYMKMFGNYGYDKHSLTDDEADAIARLI